jgi:hypothetical protein
MARHAAADVRFDFDGSLAVARRMWRFADELDALGAARRDEGEHALTTFTGVYGRQFADRVSSEVHDLGLAAHELRTAAGAWAQAWAHAINEQNRRLFARACERIERDRSLVDSVKGFFGGHHDLPPQPRQLGVPRPPHFAATGSFVRY